MTSVIENIVLVVMVLLTIFVLIIAYKVLSKKQ